MKKLFGILMVISMFAFVACDSKKDKQEKEDSTEITDSVVDSVDVDENTTEVEVAPVNNNNNGGNTTTTNPADEVVAGQGKGDGTANTIPTTPTNEVDPNKPTSNASGVNNENVQAGQGKGN